MGTPCDARKPCLTTLLKACPHCPHCPHSKTHSKKNSNKIKCKTMKVIPGSRIIGKSGKSLIVDRIEGKILHCGERKIEASAVVEVITPLGVQLENLSTLEKSDAIAKLDTLLSEFGEDTICKASFELESVFLGTFVRGFSEDRG
jgi:hypothetical protein